MTGFIDSLPSCHEVAAAAKIATASSIQELIRKSERLATVMDWIGPIQNSPVKQKQAIGLDFLSLISYLDRFVDIVSHRIGGEIAFVDDGWVKFKSHGGDILW